MLGRGSILWDPVNPRKLRECTPPPPLLRLVLPKIQ